MAILHTFCRKKEKGILNHYVITYLRIIFIQSLVKKNNNCKLKMYWLFKKSIVFAYACSFMSSFMSRETESRCPLTKT